jgi:hypothetical protein
MAVLIFGVLLGTVLGLRFKVPVLAPAITVAALVCSVVAIIGNDNWSAVWAFVEVSIAMELGYLVGADGAEVVARGLHGRHTLVSGPAHRMR